MASEKRLIDAEKLWDAIDEAIYKYDAYDKCEMKTVQGLMEAKELVYDAPTVDAVEVPDKELLRAIKLLIKQYEHSKNSEYVHSPVAHALFHTWRQVDERRTDHV